MGSGENATKSSRSEARPSDTIVEGARDTLRGVKIVMVQENAPARSSADAVVGDI